MALVAGLITSNVLLPSTNRPLIKCPKQRLCFSSQASTYSELSGAGPYSIVWKISFTVGMESKFHHGDTEFTETGKRNRRVTKPSHLRQSASICGSVFGSSCPLCLCGEIFLVKRRDAGSWRSTAR